VEAAAVLLALRVVERHDLDPVVDQALGGGIPVVDGEEHLPRPHGEAVQDSRVVGVMELDHADLELAERVEEPVGRPLDVDEREVVVDLARYAEWAEAVR